MREFEYINLNEILHSDNSAKSNLRFDSVVFLKIFLWKIYAAEVFGLKV
jgi:hypothetical protein